MGRRRGPARRLAGSRFEWLWRRPTGETAMPALFMAFDCLYARRKDLRVRALRVRRQVLEAEVEGRHHVLPARRPADAGLAVWAEVLARGYEGLVAKDLDVPGRTLAWLKVKQPHYARASAAGSRSGARGR